MDKMASVHVCLGALTILALIVIPAAHGKPFQVPENELFPEKDDGTNQDMVLNLLLNKNLSLRRPENLEIELANKLEEIEQLEKLKEHLLQVKSPEAPFAVPALSPSHPNKRACFWKYCV